MGGIFLTLYIKNNNYYGTNYEKYWLNNRAIELLVDIFWDIQNSTQKNVFDLLSVQHLIEKDSMSQRWKIQGKKKRGGHLHIEKFFQ